MRDIKGLLLGVEARRTCHNRTPSQNPIVFIVLLVLVFFFLYYFTSTECSTLRVMLNFNVLSILCLEHLTENEKLNREAITKIHVHLDDDRNGKVDLSESNEVSVLIYHQNDQIFQFFCPLTLRLNPKIMSFQWLFVAGG